MMLTSRPPDSVLGTIGDTPLVALDSAPRGVPVYAKLESFNPGGSVKDRVAGRIVEHLFATGDLRPGGTIVEPTWGNGAIGFALVGTHYDLEVVLVVPNTVSDEKCSLAAALGAEIVRVPGEGGMRAAIDRARDLAAEREDAVVPNQFSTLANPDVHYEETAPEIFESLDYEVGAVVMGCGTAGTLMGVSRYALDQDRDTWIVAVEPESKGDGTDDDTTLESTRSTVDGLASLEDGVSELYDPERVDQVIRVPDRAIHREVNRLAREEGHLVGPSSAAASVAARQVAERIDEGDLTVPHDTVVTLFPDSSDQYVSSGIYGPFEEWQT